MRNSNKDILPIKYVDNDKKIVDFKTLKYNLDELFNNTPVFNQPIIKYDESLKENQWRRIAESLFNPEGIVSKYIEKSNYKPIIHTNHSSIHHSIEVKDKIHKSRRNISKILKGRIKRVSTKSVIQIKNRENFKLNLLRRPTFVGKEDRKKRNSDSTQFYQSMKSCKTIII